MDIDFNQISDEQLEFLAEDLLRKMGFTVPQRPARGPDGGKDLIATRDRTDDMGCVYREQYLAECKQLFKSGKSVRERDIGNFESRMRLHRCNRYLLVTTTTVSETVKNQLAAISSDTSDDRMAVFWRGQDLKEKLAAYPDLFDKYFFSWKREAEIAATFCSTHQFPVHRGAILWCPGVTVIFGNDGYVPEEDQPMTEAHERTRVEVENLRDSLRNQKIEQLAFATNEDGYTWTLLVRCADARAMTDLVWECYPISTGSGHTVNYGDAVAKLNSYWDSPKKQSCGNHDE